MPITKVVHKEMMPILNKPAIHYLVNEAIDAGIEEIILVISKRKEMIKQYFFNDENMIKELEEKDRMHFIDDILKINKQIKLSFVYQEEQLGLSHAIYQASKIVGNEPFVVMLGDCLLKESHSTLKTMIDKSLKTNSSVILVDQVKQTEVNKYGIVDIDKEKEGIFKINKALEKPSIDDAPSNYAIIGRYVFTNDTMQSLNLKDFKTSKKSFTETFMQDKNVHALKLKESQWFDLGSKAGFVKANIAFAQDDKDIIL